jgi:lipoprotein-releasing system ATP-binding protein
MAEQNNPPALYLDRIERHYRQGDDTLDILRGAELGCWLGQSVALIAPSGSGKSTLLHIAKSISTALPPPA